MAKGNSPLSAILVVRTAHEFHHEMRSGNAGGVSRLRCAGWGPTRKADSPRRMLEQGIAAPDCELADQDGEAVKL